MVIGIATRDWVGMDGNGRDWVGMDGTRWEWAGLGDKDALNTNYGEKQCLCMDNILLVV